MSRLLLMITLVAGCAATTSAPIGSPTESVTTLAGRRAELIGWLHDYRVPPTRDATIVAR